MWENEHHFVDDIFKLIFLDDNCCIFSIQISLKFVFNGPILQQTSIVLGNDGLTLYRCQAIIWTNDGLV